MKFIFIAAFVSIVGISPHFLFCLKGYGENFPHLLFCRIDRHMEKWVFYSPNLGIFVIQLVP